MNDEAVQWIVRQLDKVFVGKGRARFLHALKFDVERVRESIRSYIDSL